MNSEASGLSHGSAFFSLSILFGLIFLQDAGAVRDARRHPCRLYLDPDLGWTGANPSVLGRRASSIIPQRITPSLESFPLLAIPLFVFAGNLLNVSLALPTASLPLPGHWWRIFTAASPM